MKNTTKGVFYNHSLKFVEMAFETGRFEKMTKPDGYGKESSKCGDSVEIYLSVKDDKIEFASYTGLGCLNIHACVNTMLSMIENGTVGDAWKIESHLIIDYLETLPSHEEHCAEMAVNALRKALTDYQSRCGSSWKQIYR